MGNRADRRASAKIAKQAVKRAKTPTEADILRAAAAFAGEGQVGLLGPALSRADFDAAWTRLSDDLHDILEELYPDFLVEAYIEAGTGLLQTEQPGGAVSECGTRLILCPVAGAPDRMADFARDPSENARLAASFEESGVTLEGGRCAVFPILLPLAAFDTKTTTPSLVRRLHDALSDRLAAAWSGEAEDAPETVGALVEALALPAFQASGTGPSAAVLVGIEMMPALMEIDISDEEMEAEDLARIAATQSWQDTYAADVPGLVLGTPLDWPEAAAALAWESVAIPMDEARRRRGLAEGRPDTIHCGPSDDGRQLVVSAIYGGTAVGPFSVPTDLVWLDADAFFDRAEASAETLEEHEDEGPVIAPLLGSSV
ncbi:MULTISPECIES: hypothetical protein [unclassified Aureimonas]|uniref:hypothetical protein n=1 Tax=unclassified Aureimonas TaxID=2615206 RepID=UPI000701AB00|nr:MULTISPECIES: hypothetical protein [unclassified Aureimonas]KQT64038.1 hypothetical protein ASG62_03195 [Aureimonas sp. Leaf427]KQT81231.1 hypothetical protein ASG54_00465 [Aureimonas sp. Leaf460]